MPYYKIRVIGSLWQPGFTAAMEYTAREAGPSGPCAGDLVPGEFDEWITRNTGDFSSVIDYEITRVEMDNDRAHRYTVVRPWSDVESELAFLDCTCGGDE